MRAVEMDEAGSPSVLDPDPITEVYDVYIQPHISEDRQIYVLQFPNRDSKKHYTKSNDAQPLTLRVKPEAGMLETDVPLDVWHNYDREKGLKWGDAMKKSNVSKGGGSHGMPGGFGIGGAQPTGRGRGRGDAEIDPDQSRLSQDYHYREAVERGQVLAKQTLGGETISNEELASQYLIGVYRGSKTICCP
jgi:DNA-directed RNA polymerase-3 subunit RPC5